MPFFDPSKCKRYINDEILCSSGTEEITINPNSQWFAVPVKLDIKEEGWCLNLLKYYFIFRRAPRCGESPPSTTTHMNALCDWLIITKENESNKR
jgi:hypothetical protein